MTEKKNDVLDVMVRSDTKSEENISNYEQDADDNKIDDPDEDETDDEYVEQETFHTPQRNIRPAVYGVLTVGAVITAFLIGSLIGKVKEEPEPIMTTEPVAETATPETTVLPETSALPSATPESEDDQEEGSELDEEDVEEKQDDKTDEEEKTDTDNSESDATPEPSASPTPDPSIYNGIAPMIGGKTSGRAETTAHTPAPSQPDDTAVNAAASRLMASQNGMSRAELVNGLISSGYTSEQANRAADNLAVSWTQQAIYRAMSLYDRNTYTRDTLIVELVLAGFSQSDAHAAADAVGA